MLTDEEKRGIIEQTIRNLEVQEYNLELESIMNADQTQFMQNRINFVNSGITKLEAEKAKFPVVVVPVTEKL